MMLHNSAIVSNRLTDIIVSILLVWLCLPSACVTFCIYGTTHFWNFCYFLSFACFGANFHEIDPFVSQQTICFPSVLDTVGWAMQPEKIILKMTYYHCTHSLQEDVLVRIKQTKKLRATVHVSKYVTVFLKCTFKGVHTSLLVPLPKQKRLQCLSEMAVSQFHKSGCLTSVGRQFQTSGPVAELCFHHCSLFSFILWVLHVQQMFIIDKIITVGGYVFQHQPDDSVTNRVAGFVCKHIFSEHQSTVTSLVAVGREQAKIGTYLVGTFSALVCGL